MPETRNPVHRATPRALALIVAGALAVAPAAAPRAQPAADAATPEQTAAAAAFLKTLADDVFAILRDRTLSEPEKDRRLRALLVQNVAVRPLGDRLIRRHRATITPEQYQAYSAAFPDFVVGAYGDRLRSYSAAEFKVVRALARGSRGDVDVVARVAERTGQPFDSIWTVGRDPQGRWRLLNLTVAGVNLGLTQEADFSAYIQRNGFDALVRFMRQQGAKAG
jgi:phospholipid transport system substrate-binding protein